KGIVEAEQARLRLSPRAVTVDALIRSGETQPAAPGALFTRRFFENNLTGFSIGDFGCVHNARAIFGTDDDTIEKHKNGQRKIEVEQRFRCGELEDPALLPEAIESAGTQFREACFESFNVRRISAFCNGSSGPACLTRAHRNLHRL